MRLATRPPHSGPPERVGFGPPKDARIGPTFTRADATGFATSGGSTCPCPPRGRNWRPCRCGPALAGHEADDADEYAREEGGIAGRTHALSE